MGAGATATNDRLPFDDGGELDVSAVREDFPILTRRIAGRPLAYLDSAATSQKPQEVLDALTRYYVESNANVHRSAYTLAEEATTAYEDARATVARFVGAEDPSRLVFTRGTTESINLVANSWALPRLEPGDIILLTQMEHHSNLVPWQMVAQKTGAKLRYVNVTPEGRLCRTAFRKLLSPRVKVFSLVHASNVLGTINPIRELLDELHQTAPGALTVVDGAQSVPHMPVDFEALGCDFLAFSGHKLYGPMGIGALVGRAARLEEMEPYQGGGEMIDQVTLQETTYAAPPTRFEAGTPNAAGAIGMAAAVRYLQRLGIERVRRHGIKLTAYALDRLRNAADLRVFGPLDPAERSALVSFLDDEMHPHDLTALLDAKGIAVRAGHHCAQPLHEHIGAAATTRASFGLYNDENDVDRLVEAILDARRMFGRARRRA